MISVNADEQAKVIAKPIPATKERNQPTVNKTKDDGLEL